MKLLKDKANSLPNTTPGYPFGSMLDRASGVQGSEMNTEFHGDSAQFFEKMFSESGITANGLPDNSTNGFQLWEAAKRVAKGYKTYSATFSYSSGPNRLEVDTLHQDDLDIGSITLSEISAGVYQFNVGSLYTLVGSFGVIGTWRCENGFAVWPYVDYSTTTDYNLVIETSVLGGSPSTVSMGAVFIELRIYD